MNKITWIALIFSVTISACKQPVKNITDKTGKTIETNKIIAHQKSESDTITDYCYYLPSQYNGTNKLPVIFFLDPHGNGSEPIKKYFALANKYGFIMVGSNNIKNGQNANYTIGLFQMLLAETKKKFIVDESRMFSSGFSGGAKMAIIFAQEMPEIIGVAACGASLPLSSDHQPHYYYAGIVGNQDFNYLESNQTFSVFDQNNYDYTSVIFNGGHEWPPVDCYELAIIGFEIYAMKLKRIEKNDKWLDMVWTKMTDSIAHFKKTSNLINEKIYLQQTNRWFYGLKNTKELDKRINEIEQSKPYFDLVRKRQKLIQTEVKLRGEFIKAIEQRDLNWWGNEINRINESIGQNDKEVAQVSQRLLNYLSMAGFMLVKTDLADSRMDDAAKKLKVYELVDPDNPDVYLMYARYYMQLNNLENMKVNFNKAKELGFNDFETYKNDSFWYELMSRMEQ